MDSGKLVKLPQPQCEERWVWHQVRFMEKFENMKKKASQLHKTRAGLHIDRFRGTIKIAVNCCKT
jgi:hypothetical protein